MNCDNCFNSRLVLSENGVHYVCCLSGRNTIECIIGQKDHYKPVKRREENVVD